MKKSTKSMLITALILFCAGLLLALSSALYVKIVGIDAFGIPQKSKNIENKTLTVTDLLASSPESNYVKKLSQTPFTRIDLSSYTGNIEIKSAEETKLELQEANTNNLQIEIIGETLKICEIDPVYYMGLYIDGEGISFKGLRQIFSTGSSANTKKNVILYLDAETCPKQIDIDSAFGDIKIDGISSEIINIHSDFGKVFVQNLKDQNTKLNLNGSITDFDVKNVLYASCSIQTKIGDIDLHLAGEQCKNSVLETLMGDVSVLTDVPTAAFKLNLSTTLGKISRNGEEMGKEHSDSSQRANRITCSTVIGKVAVSFNGDNEENFVPVDGTLPETLPATNEENITAENAA